MNTIYDQTLTDLFGDTLDWSEDDASVAYIPCPGRGKHTTKAGRKDTRIYLNGYPTVHCLHQSCQEECEEATKLIRGALKAAGWEPPPMTPEQRAVGRARHNHKLVAERARKNFDWIHEHYRWTVADIERDGGLDVAANQMEMWGDFLDAMFQPTDNLWCGEPHHTGGSHYSKHFQTCQTWTMFGPSGPFMCANPLKFDVVHRSLDSLSDRRYFVVEGDACSHDPDENRDMCGAIFKYAMAAQPSLKLCAVIDAGNKSLHGWFEYTSEEIHRWCVDVLPAVGGDPATMRLSQPVRVPGYTRNNGKEQRLIWLKK